MENSPQQRLADRIRNFTRSRPQPTPARTQEWTLARGELGKTLRSIKKNAATGKQDVSAAGGKNDDKHGTASGDKS